MLYDTEQYWQAYSYNDDQNFSEYLQWREDYDILDGLRRAKQAAQKETQT